MKDWNWPIIVAILAILTIVSGVAYAFMVCERKADEVTDEYEDNY